MGVIYLVDTNIVSEIMRPDPVESVKTAWIEHRDEIAISSITWHELRAGIYRLPQSKRRTAFENFLNEYVEKLLLILPYDKASANWHAVERTRLSQIGKTPSFSDGQIAAVAATNELILVTRNVSDFSEFRTVKIENWFDK